MSATTSSVELTNQVKIEDFVAHNESDDDILNDSDEEYTSKDGSEEVVSNRSYPFGFDFFRSLPPRVGSNSDLILENLSVTLSTLRASRLQESENTLKILEVLVAEEAKVLASLPSNIARNHSLYHAVTDEFHNECRSNADLTSLVHDIGSLSKALAVLSNVDCAQFVRSWAALSYVRDVLFEGVRNRVSSIRSSPNYKECKAVAVVQGLAGFLIANDPVLDKSIHRLVTEQQATYDLHSVLHSTPAAIDSIKPLLAVNSSHIPKTAPKETTTAVNHPVENVTTNNIANKDQAQATLFTDTIATLVSNPMIVNAALEFVKQTIDPGNFEHAPAPAGAPVGVDIPPPLAPLINLVENILQSLASKETTTPSSVTPVAPPTPVATPPSLQQTLPITFSVLFPIQSAATSNGTKTTGTTTPDSNVSFSTTINGQPATFEQSRDLIQSIVSLL